MKYNKVVSIIIIGMFLLEIFIFILLITGGYTSPLCLDK
jgi:hypothetical protein